MLALEGCDPAYSIFLTTGLADPDPRVRQAALDSMVCPPIELIAEIVQNLGDANITVIKSAADALGRTGEPALKAVVKALDTPAFESGALQALENLPVRVVQADLRQYVTGKVDRALADQQLGQALPENGEGPTGLLADSLKRRGQNQGFLALRTFGLLGDNRAVTLAMEGLQSNDAAQSAYALESLEALQGSGIIRPLLRLWEGAEPIPPASEMVVLHVLDDSDAWLRACAAFAARDSTNPEIAARLSRLAQSDPDELVRLTAASALTGDKSMETLPTLTTMERILFLRKVALFKGLPPLDLKQVAAIGMERLYLDGEAIVHQGDLGDELFIIISGQVRVTTDTGKELAIRNAGEYVGEMALLDQAPRSATLLALGNARLLCVAKDDFEAILRQRPEVSLSIINVLCARLRQRST
jgi:CRP/FNR family transcriptional regulator